MAAPRDERGLSYSGLEVVQPPLEAAAHHSDPGIEVYHDPNLWKKPLADGVLPAETDPHFSPLFARPSSRDAPEVAQNQHDGVYDNLPPPPPTICGIRRRVFWVVAGIVAFVVVAGAVGGGVGGYFASKSSSAQGAGESDNGSPGSNTTTPTRSAFQNISIAALGWTDASNVRQIRVYHATPSNSTNPPRIIESSWDSVGAKWPVETVTDPAVDGIKAGTPMAASAGYPHTNTSFALVSWSLRAVLVQLVVYNSSHSQGEKRLLFPAHRQGG